MTEDLNKVIDDSLPKLEEWARRYVDIRAIILFGSRARGVYRLDSDVDVCVLVDQHAGETWYTRWIHQAEKWKREFLQITAIPENMLQFCTVTSDKAKAGLGKSCRFLYLRADDPNSLRPVDEAERSTW